MYHGLKFGPDGKCNEIPGQARISPAVRVKSYPTVEKHGAVWIWMGVPELAEADQVPPIVGPDAPEWALTCSSMVMEANARLIWDNLLDLSHAPFVHLNSFSGGDKQVQAIQMKGEVAPQITVSDRGVHLSRWHVGRPSNPYVGDMPSDDLSRNDFLAPGVFVLKTVCYKQGVQQRSNEPVPSEEPILARITSQVITPISETKSKFFFNFGPWAKLADRKADFFKVAAKAFDEDKFFIQAQQQVMERLPDRKVMPLHMDVALIRFAGIMDKLLKEDRQIMGGAEAKLAAATSV
jgi:vanillate O-demethylase monooxygenase subunit